MDIGKLVDLDWADVIMFFADDPKDAEKLQTVASGLQRTMERA